MSSIDTMNEPSNVTSLPTAPKPQTSKEVIAANVKLLIEQFEAGHSEGLTAYLTAMGKFHNYSFGNILDIARQMPSASRVAGDVCMEPAWTQGEEGTATIQVHRLPVVLEDQAAAIPVHKTAAPKHSALV
jgi:hypothetical protein